MNGTCMIVSPSTRRAFSLVELLTVIFIVVLVIAIVLPALGGARDAAKKATTSQQLTELLNSVSTFQQDSRRLPGYFSAREMGSSENMNNQGFTSMENMMLDLLGQEAVAKTKPAKWTVGTNPASGDTIQVGPVADTNKVYVNLSLLSTDKKAYYNPPAKQFVAQYSDGTVIKQFGAAGNTAKEGDNQMPDLVDAFGNPILAWVQDDTASLRPVDAVEQFASDYDQTASNKPVARFWWAQNAGFLKATSTGKNGVNQKTDSLLGESASVNDRAKTLMALLGNPNTPVQGTATGPTADLLAGGPKGRVLVQSAGKDGVFLKNDGKQSGRGSLTAGGPLVYGLGLKDVAGKPNLDSEGKTAVFDIISGFDDLTVAGGN